MDPKPWATMWLRNTPQSTAKKVRVIKQFNDRTWEVREWNKPDTMIICREDQLSYIPPK